jgi:TRAP-type C4-dicarboxylate transport system permease small subunit
MVFLFNYSLMLCQTAAKNISAGLQISMSIPYACMPIGVVLMILTSLEVIFKNILQIRELGKEEVSG